MRYTHFVGFNGEEYHSAVKAFAAFHTLRMGLESAAKIADGSDHLRERAARSRAASQELQRHIE